MTKLLIATTISSTMNAFLLPYVEHFRSLGWKVDGMARGISRNESCQRAFHNTFEVEWRRNPLDPRNFLGIPRQIRDIVKREKYDLVHVHTPVAAFVLRLALRKLERPKVIYTAHGFHFHQGGSFVGNTLFLALEKLAAQWTDRLIVINQEDVHAARHHKLLPEQRINYMPGIGVDICKLNSDNPDPGIIADVRKEIGLNKKDHLLLMVAEFNPGKRHRVALEAFSHLNRPDVHIAFAGTGPEEESIKTLAIKLNVAERVHFLGWRRDVAALMRASLALILPSEREGLPRSVMEAMTLGTPVIGSDIRGNRDLLSEGCGILVPLGDVEQLTAAMVQVIEEPEFSKQLTIRAHERIAEFDLRQVIEMHEKLYGETLTTELTTSVDNA